MFTNLQNDYATMGGVQGLFIVCLNQQATQEQSSPADFEPVQRHAGMIWVLGYGAHASNVPA